MQLFTAHAYTVLQHLCWCVGCDDDDIRA